MSQAQQSLNDLIGSNQAMNLETVQKMTIEAEIPSNQLQSAVKTLEDLVRSLRSDHEQALRDQKAHAEKGITKKDSQLEALKEKLSEADRIHNEALAYEAKKFDDFKSQASSAKEASEKALQGKQRELEALTKHMSELKKAQTQALDMAHSDHKSMKDQLESTKKALETSQCSLELERKVHLFQLQRFLTWVAPVKSGSRLIMNSDANLGLADLLDSITNKGIEINATAIEDDVQLQTRWTLTRCDPSKLNELPPADQWHGSTALLFRLLCSHNEDIEAAIERSIDCPTAMTKEDVCIWDWVIEQFVRVIPSGSIGPHWFIIATLRCIELVVRSKYAMASMAAHVQSMKPYLDEYSATTSRKHVLIGSLWRWLDQATKKGVSKDLLEFIIEAVDPSDLLTAHDGRVIIRDGDDLLIIDDANKTVLDISIDDVFLDILTEQKGWENYFCIEFEAGAPGAYLNKPNAHATLRVEESLPNRHWIRKHAPELFESERQDAQYKKLLEMLCQAGTKTPGASNEKKRRL